MAYCLVHGGSDDRVAVNSGFFLSSLRSLSSFITHQVDLDGTCAEFRDNAPIFLSTTQCGVHTVYQYNLWYGQQLGCFWFGRQGFLGNPEDAFGNKHSNDNEYVQVWVGPQGDVAMVSNTLPSNIMKSKVQDP